MHQRWMLLLGLAASLLPGAAWSGEFTGTGALAPNPADPTGLTRILIADLFFRQDGNTVWKANAGNITDGASIPVELQGLIGAPFTAEFIKAAVIHDHYCDKVNENRVRSWQSTHRVFYDMLRASGVPLVKSKLMFYAVYTFGPKWGYLDQGDFCGVNCINNIEPRYFEKNEYSFYAADPQEYDSVLGMIQNNPDVDLTVLEELAKARHPNDNSFRFTQYPAGSSPQ